MSDVNVRNNGSSSKLPLIIQQENPNKQCTGGRVVLEWHPCDIAITSIRLRGYERMFESDFDKRPLSAGRELERASLFAQADRSIQCEFYPRAETALYRVDTLCGRILCDRLFSEQFLSLWCEETACNSRQPSDDLVFDAIYNIHHEFLHTKLHSKLEMCHGVGCHEERPAVQRLSTRPWTKRGRDGFLKVPRTPLTDDGSHQVKPDPSDLACS